jgi:hypothetical protein
LLVKISQFVVLLGFCKISSGKSSKDNYFWQNFRKNVKTSEKSAGFRKKRQNLGSFVKTSLILPKLRKKRQDFSNFVETSEKTSKLRKFRQNFRTNPKNPEISQSACLPASAAATFFGR